MIEPRFPVTAEEIDTVVRDFYARIRSHPVLGPVFANHVTDWPEHEAKIAGFWRNAILFERGYAGNPMMAHVAAGDVTVEMFAPWLDLFESVLRRHLAPPAAEAWNQLARRIGQSLGFGLTLHEGPPGLR